MTSWPNVTAYNYIYLFEPNLSFSIKSLKRTIDVKLKQATSVKLLIEVCMVVVWHTLSKWKETTIACISYYTCLNVIDKESEWLILAFSLCEILRAYYNYNSPYCTLCTFDYVLRWQINVATLVCFCRKWNNLSLWDILGKQLIWIYKAWAHKEDFF